MSTDLAQVIGGVQEIVKDLSSRKDNPIFNYIYVGFNDPGK